MPRMVTAQATIISTNRPRSNLATKESPRSVLSSPHWTLVTRAPSSPGKPRVGITIGDPAGIGPEVVLKAVGDPRCARPVRRLSLALPLKSEDRRRRFRLMPIFPLMEGIQFPGAFPRSASFFDTGNVSEIGTLGSIVGGIRACLRLRDRRLRGALSWAALDASDGHRADKQGMPKLAGSPFLGPHRDDHRPFATLTNHLCAFLQAI